MRRIAGGDPLLAVHSKLNAYGHASMHVHVCMYARMFCPSIVCVCVYACVCLCGYTYGHMADMCVRADAKLASAFRRDIAL